MAYRYYLDNRLGLLNTCELNSQVDWTSDAWITGPARWMFSCRRWSSTAFPQPDGGSGLTPSAVSKMITRIEDRLGTRLLVRSTRTLQLTPEGEIYRQRALRIVAEIEEAERAVAFGASAAPRGPAAGELVRAGGRALYPAARAEVPASAIPRWKLDVSLTDGVVDLIEERADIAIRVGPMRNSSLKARKLFESRVVVIASPDYLAKHGMPSHPRELARHNCLTFNFRRVLNEWPFNNPETGETEMLDGLGQLPRQQWRDRTADVCRGAWHCPARPCSTCSADILRGPSRRRCWRRTTLGTWRLIRRRLRRA